MYLHGYKDGIKGYKMWNLDTMIVVYRRDVILREYESYSNIEGFKPINDRENIEFNLRKESHDLEESTKSKEEVEV